MKRMFAWLIPFILFSGWGAYLLFDFIHKPQVSIPQLVVSIGCLLLSCIDAYYLLSPKYRDMRKMELTDREKNAFIGFYMVFNLGLFLGFLMGIGGRTPPEIMYKTPLDWVKYYRSSLNSYKEGLLSAYLVFPATFHLGMLIGGCIGALLPPDVAQGILVAMGLIIAVSLLAGARVLFVIGGGHLIANVGGAFEIIGLVAIFAL